ncbi:helix-turn-helix domain-containing protein [Paenibacillus sp. 1P07SE]|uniref:response regulator transcription factor n=1 Tax=Paenibacillus sp. 1P07SE TaxID=3132209 RepID=UPI0039A62E0C
MWNVLIVEDEPFVRKAFIKHTNWEAYGFTVVGEAEDGKEALEKIKSLKPDLVISDIVMPMMDGLELLHAARSEGCNARFVMLSCMNEFAYAQEAIRQGASGYILKSSMTPHELRQTLEKVREELDRDKRSKQLMDEFKLKDWYEELWRQWTGAADAAVGSLSSPPELPNDRVTVVTALYSPAWHWSVVQEGSGMLVEDDAVIHEFHHHDTINWFIWSKTAAAPRQVYTACSKKMPTSAYVLANLRPEQLSEGWQTVLNRVYECWYAGQAESQLIHLGAIAPNRARLTATLPWELEKNLIQCVSSYQPQPCREAMEAIWEYARQQVIPYHHLKSIWQRLLRQIADLCGHPLPSDGLLGIASPGSPGGFKETVWKLIEECGRQLSKQSPIQTDHAEVNKMLQYIHYHYHAPISLADLSAYVNLEEHYISALFKRKTGMAFVNYVNQYRIDQAKRLLLSTDMSVSEIGMAVGFASDNHFSKMFKRWLGVTPGIYRLQSQKPSPANC